MDMDRIIDEALQEGNDRQIEIKKIEDIVKLKELPRKIILDGIPFLYGGGMSEPLYFYIKKDKIAYIEYYVDSLFDDVSYDLAREKFGATRFKITFKANGLSIVPDRTIFTR